MPDAPVMLHNNELTGPILVTSRQVVSLCTILISSQLAACRSTSSAEVTSGAGGGSSVTAAM